MNNSENEIRDKVKRALRGTPFAASALTKLSGGTANFMYHATLENSSQEHPDGVVVKQGEAYVATNPAFPLTTSRCAIEQESLIHLAALPPATTPSCVVSTPAVYHFNQDTNTQIQEYLPNAVSLKNYALEHYAAPTPESLRPQCEQLGHGLGAWLREFHAWSQEPGQAALRDVFAGNREMQGLKNMINYQQLLQMADRHPTILGDARDVLQGISDLAAGELVDETALYVIHGDFWTGNVLLPDVPIQEGAQTPIRIVDWEMAQLGVRPLDLGQMIAELWQLKLYKDLDAGEWLIRAFADGYGTVDDEFAYRTIIHVGVHLICFGSQTPGWGTAEQNMELVKVGKEVLVKAWNKDRDSFYSQNQDNTIFRITRSALDLVFVHFASDRGPSISASDSDARLRYKPAFDCYVQYVSLKMNKRLGALHKEIRVSTQPTARRYLAGLSFGPSSNVLAQLLDETTQRHSTKKSSSPFESIIVHIDTDLSPAGEESPARKLLDGYRQKFAYATFECIPLAEVLSVQTIDWSTLPLDADTPGEDPTARLRRLFDALPTVTSRADILRQLIRHLLLHTARERSCSALLLGHSTTALAALTLSEVANGRGFAVPLQVADGMTTVCTYDPTPGGTTQETSRDEFPVYYPMREVFRNEILQYINLIPSLKEIVPLEQASRTAGGSVVSHKDQSIEEVMARYFDSVEEGYSGIVANVVRTTGKLGRVPGHSFCGSCGMSLDAAGDSRWAGEIGDDSADGSSSNRLCYGCKRSIHG
ncbi:hypothetical protein FDECE_10940 [Fusarium decemcellulare]|nr:hypothetical protein FDECE_10940 [Fusarium decemcellulare]